MSTYHVYGRIIGSQYIGKIEADNEKEAIEKAWKEYDPHVSLCHQCGDQCADGIVEELIAELEEER